MVSVDAIRFQAQVFKVQTLVDGGLRVTLDLPKDNLQAAMELMECASPGVLIEVAAVPLKGEDVREKHRKIHI